jgi:microcystin-dependent protein
MEPFLGGIYLVSFNFSLPEGQLYNGQPFTVAQPYLAGNVNIAMNGVFLSRK